jgi:hypothetical protein
MAYPNDRRVQTQPVPELPHALSASAQQRALSVQQLEQIVDAYQTALDCRRAAERAAAAARGAPDRAQLVQDVLNQSALVAEFARAVSTTLVMVATGRRESDRVIYEAQSERNVAALHEAARMCMDTIVDLVPNLQ